MLENMKHDDEKLRESLLFHKVNENEYQWYCDMKREFPLETSGFGLGMERYLMWLLKLNDIRDCAVFPRDNNKEIYP